MPRSRDDDREHAEIDLAREPDFQLGGLTVRPSVLEILTPPGSETVQPRVMQVLVRLRRAQGQVVSRDELIAECWGGRVVSEDAINRSIAMVRQLARLSEPPAFTVETIPRVGYRLRAAGMPAVVSAPARSAPAEPRRQSTGRVFVAVIALLVAFGAIFLVARLQPKPASPRSVAILPVRNLTSDPTNDGFAQKLTEDAINMTSRGGYVLATPVSSVQASGLVGLDARAVARRLRVAHVVLASLRRDPPGWRLAVQVIDARTGEVETSQDIAVSDAQPSPESALAAALFDIAAHRATAAWYKAELSRPLAPHDPENLSARIMAASDDVDPADLARIDQIAALALAATPPGDPLRINQGTAMCRLWARRIDEGRYADVAQRTRLAQQALDWADRALAARDTLTSPHACRAHVLALIGRWEEADAEVRHILARTPLTSVGWWAKQDLDFRQGRFAEAVKDAAVGSERDMDVHDNALKLGAAQLFAGDPGAAIASLQDAVVTDRADPSSALLLAAAYELDGRTGEARTAADAYRALRFDPAPWRLFVESPVPAFAARATKIQAALAGLGLTAPADLRRS